jgi:hypothetical protein
MMAAETKRELKRRKIRGFMCDELEVERFSEFRNQDCKFDGRVEVGVCRSPYETFIAPDLNDLLPRPEFLWFASFCYANANSDLARSGKSGWRRVGTERGVGQGKIFASDKVEGDPGRLI